MRFLKIGLISAFLSTAVFSQAHAQLPNCGVNDSLDGGICGGESTSPTPGGGGGGSGGGGSGGGGGELAPPPPGMNYIPVERLTTGADGQPCVGTAYVVGSAGQVAADPSFGVDPNILLGDYAPCPASTRQPIITPGMVAARFWQEILLPKPHPYIAPGRAIAGKWAYLETHGETRFVHTQDTILGPLEIVATGEYYVDWGDGQTSGPHNGEGAPWPDGEIRHTYVWAGTVDIVVTERWTATWRLGSASGNLRQLRTTGTIEDFPVQEIQAVRER